MSNKSQIEKEELGQAIAKAVGRSWAEFLGDQVNTEGEILERVHEKIREILRFEVKCNKTHNSLNVEIFYPNLPFKTIYLVKLEPIKVDK